MFSDSILHLIAPNVSHCCQSEKEDHVRRMGLGCLGTQPVQVGSFSRLIRVLFTLHTNKCIVLLISASMLEGQSFINKSLNIVSEVCLLMYLGCQA